MKNSLFAVLGSTSSALAAVRGFNYASQGQSQQMFEASFRTAASLEGASDFTSARLYTMIQEGTTNSPIDAIPAAIDTKTSLLLGLWASSAQSGFDNEIAALKAAISQYGSDFADLVTGISVGSEDLYRISVTGLANDPTGVGQTPSVLVDYIGQVREAIKGTSLSGKPVGHVDTWNAFVNGSNQVVIDACDFLGLDEYPYYQTTDSNGIDNAKQLFFEAYDKVAAVSNGAKIWVTEAGWPTSGPQSAEAVASVNNAETFWQDVACELENRDINFWWYILEDAGASVSFGVSQGGKPLYNLACNASSSNTTLTGDGVFSNSTSITSSGSSTSAGKTSTAVVTATATGGSSHGSSGSSTVASASSSVSSFTNAANRLEGSLAILAVAVVAMALSI